MDILLSAIYVILIILAFLILWQILVRVVRRYLKFPAPAFIGGFLDSRYRKHLQPPQKIVENSGIIKGMKVLEIGCGSGAFTIGAARAIGGNGILYALDIEESMLKQLQRKLARPENADIRNIVPVHKSAYDLPFEDSSLDLVFMVTVLQEIPDKQRSLSEIKRVLKPGGTLAVSEWLFDPDYPWQSTTRRQCEKEGFVFNISHGNLWSYTVRFKKP